VHNNDNQHIFLGEMLADFYHEPSVGTITLKNLGVFLKQNPNMAKELGLLIWQN
jgi:hypothetical protein